MRSDLIFICVNYRSEECALKLLRQLSEQESIKITVLLVDNNNGFQSREADLDKFRPFLELHLISPNENLGYLGAAEYALRSHQEAMLPTLPVIVSNADIEIRDREMLSRLVKRCLDHEVAIVAPRIISLRTGCDQNPYIKLRSFSKTALRKKLWIMENYPIYTLYFWGSLGKRYLRGVSRRLWAKDKGHTPVKIYAPHGSFIALTPQFFLSGGSLAAAPKLFVEELFLAEECRRNGVKVVYDPELLVYHLEHLCILEGFFPSRKRLAWHAQSLSTCINRYFQDA